MDELRMWGWLNPTDEELLNGFIELLTNPEWATSDDEEDSDHGVSDGPLDLQ